MIDGRQRTVALLVAGCFFMEFLDGTIVTTAVPRIAGDLAVPDVSVGLIITAYLIALAVFIPLSGWMVQRLGTRRVFLSAIAVFTLASALCALSESLPELVAMRVLQGIGGAMMVPVGRLAVLANAAKSDTMQLIAYLVWPALVAPVIAPLAGGVITTYANWRWLFVVNIPLGIVALLVARKVMWGSRAATVVPLDLLGASLSVLSIGGLTYASSLLSQQNPDWILLAAIGLPSLALAATGVRHLRRTAHPLLDLSTLKIASFRAAIGPGSIFIMTIGAVPFLLPLLFQNLFGWSPIKSGAVVLFLFVGNIGIKPATSRLLNTFGFRRVLLTAGSGLIASLVCAAWFTASWPVPVLAVVMMLSGVCRSVGGTAYNTLSFSDVPPRQMADANSLQAMSQQLSLGLGVALASIALRLGQPLGRLLPGVESLGDRYTVAFLLLAAVAAVPVLSAVTLGHDVGDATRTPANAIRASRSR